MAEDFGVEGRGRFYDEVGCIRDVIENHLLNVLLLLAMEPPVGRSADDQIDEKVQVLKAIRTLTKEDVVRGQFVGYLKEPGVAPNSPVETFAAVRFSVDTWRWQGVPFFIRAGKSLPVHVTEVVVRLKPPPLGVFDDIAPGNANYVRFRIAPQMAIAVGARRKEAGDEMVGEQVELIAVDDDTGDMEPYERLIGDAMNGNSQLFTRQDASEIAWRIVESGPQRSNAAARLPARNLGPCRGDGRLRAAERLDRSDRSTEGHDGEMEPGRRRCSQTLWCWRSTSAARM